MTEKHLPAWRPVVAVASHKPYRMPTDRAYLPIHVGAALNPNVCEWMQGDDTGDNISTKNGSYCELTALYWLWKNVVADAKGLVHYRRLLGSPDIARRKAKDPFDRLVTSIELKELLAKHQVVVAKRRNYYIETVYNHYSQTFDGGQFDICREILCELHPDYVEAWDDLMQSRSAHIFNMFVMRSELFDAYCAWMFPILEELEKRVDTTGYDAFANRFVGRVSERLLDPWLKVNGIDYTELPIVSPEPVDWNAKVRGFLAAKFLGRKYEKSF